MCLQLLSNFLGWKWRREWRWRINQWAVRKRSKRSFIERKNTGIFYVYLVMFDAVMCWCKIKSSLKISKFYLVSIYFYFFKDFAAFFCSCVIIQIKSAIIYSKKSVRKWSDIIISVNFASNWTKQLRRDSWNTPVLLKLLSTSCHVILLICFYVLFCLTRFDAEEI